ncbi:MAG: prepilin-type N-terminal cleavage/methylation domain-containing protein [Candidatus Pacebacteria bacterium]|nr:prepilin-type N-terminal cleavage/methylation domain-containing protein [Candidatus Paceibacterota bacterium]
MNRNKAFTLIELLVVISIVSLLSTVVIAAVNSAREKARIARGLQFDQSVKHAIGDNLVAEINFDNSNLVDSTGYGNNAAVVAGTTNYITPGAIRTAFSFDGSTYLRINPTSSELSSMIVDGIFTVSFWFKTDATAEVGFGGGVNSDHWAWDVRTRPDGRIYSPTLSIYSSSGVNLSNNKWHHVLLVRDSPNNIIKLYVDGLINSTIPDVTMGGGGPGSVYIGSSAFLLSSGSAIDELRIYHAVYGN